MTPCCCPPPVDYDPIFSDRTARDDLRAFRRDGAQGTTKRLIEALVAEGVEGASVIDVGAGVGAVSFGLLDAGADSFTDVDASHAYLDAARSEAERRGVADRATFRFGDFVSTGPELEPADVVAMDRVICCYPDWRALTATAISRSTRLIGLVYPVDRWWLRQGIKLLNLWMRFSRQSYRSYVHPSAPIEAQLRAAGFERRFLRRQLVWQTAVYRRAS